MKNMGRLKVFRKYILWILGFYIFSTIMIYIGLNATYRNIEPIDEVAGNIKVDVAQATKVNGRIYGNITSTEDTDLNGKYIKISIYNRKKDLVGIKYLKIENIEKNQPKKFVAYFTSNKVKYYTVEITEDNEEIRQDILRVKELYKDVFTDEEMKAITVLTLIFGLAYMV